MPTIGNGPWKVHISRDPARLGASIFIYRELSAHRVEVMRFSEKGEPISTTFDSTAAVERSFYLSREEDVREIIAAFTEAGKVFGVQPPNESYSVGKIEGMKEHLEDMRKLVFAEEKVINVPEATWKGVPLSKLSDEQWDDFKSHTMGHFTARP